MGTKIKIYFFGDQWDDMWRRRQQLAWHLAQSESVEHVVYIERPLPVTSFLKFLIGRADRDGTDRWRRMLHNRSWVMPAGEKLSVLTTFTPLGPVGSAWLFRFSEWFRDRWLIKNLNEKFHWEKPIVWISYPQISTEVLRALKPGLLWYDWTDDFTDRPGYSSCVKEQIRVTDQWLTKHSRVVTTASSSIYKEKRRMNSTTYWLPNAVDTELFLSPSGNFPVPVELQQASRPVLAFVGGLNDWAHDWELLNQVATLRPGWTFLLIGGLSVSGKVEEMLHHHSNIICVGKKPYEELPAYLVHSDVCFQFYSSSWRTDTCNTQKLFLYFAAGKPVVSTPLTPTISAPSGKVEQYRKWVKVAGTAVEFIESVEKSLVEDNPGLRQERKALAQKNSWQERTTQILEILRNAC